MSLRRMMIAMTLGNFIKGLIKSFKTRVLGDGGTFEAEACLEAQLNQLNEQNVLESASLIITPNGYNTSTLCSVIKNDGTTDLTLTRNTIGTRIDENNLVKSETNNIPRLNYKYGEQCPSILVEPVMTNNWTNNNTTTGYNSNTNAVKGSEVVDAFGTGFNGYEYTFNSTGQIFVSSAYSIRVFDTRTFPVNRLCLFIKNPSSDYFSINFSFVAQATFRFSDLTSYNSNGSIVKINDDTYALYVHNDTSTMSQFSQVRCSFVSGFAANPSPVDGTAILGLGFWHRATTVTQVSNVYSPIITTSSTVTRVGDFYRKSLATDIIGQTEGTIFIDFERTKIPGCIKALLTMFSVTNDETFFLQTSNNLSTSINLQIVSVSNGVNVIRSMNLLDGRNKIAVVYSTTGTKVFLNGDELTPLTNTALPVMDIIDLSNRANQRIYGDIYQFALWKTQITDQQAINLTTL